MITGRSQNEARHQPKGNRRGPNLLTKDIKNVYVSQNDRMTCLKEVDDVGVSCGIY